MPIAPNELLTHLAAVIASHAGTSHKQADEREVATFFELLTPGTPSTLAGYEYRRRHATRSTRQLNNVKHVTHDVGLAIDAVRTRVGRMSQTYGPNKVFTVPADLYESESGQNLTPSSRLSRDVLDTILSRVDDRTFLALASGSDSLITAHMRETTKLKSRLLITSNDVWHDSIMYPFYLTRQLLQAAQENPSAAVLALQIQVGRIAAGEFDCFLTPSHERKARVSRAAAEGTQLDFEFLPPGTDTRQLAEDIANRALKSRGGAIDLRRIGVIRNIRDYFGEERCKLAHGARSSREAPSRTGSNVDEDYIVLVVQHRGPDGRAGAEDALAISPITNKNATFFVRHDACRKPWREIFAQTKQDAQELGAQRLVFREGPGMTAYDAMWHKVIALSECSSRDFHNGLRYDRKRRRYVAK